MAKLEFRTLKPNEIELRVGSVSDKGATLLLYKDARCDMAILDETVGATNWQRKHVRENKNCIVSIWDDDKRQWVEKEDTGTENFMEKEKSLASDSFKRACTNWGIGRELYTAPFIFLYCSTQQKRDGRGYELVEKYLFNDCYVSEITYDDNRCIENLVICDKNGKEMWVQRKKENKAKDIAKTEKEIIEELREAAKEEAKEITETPKEAVAKRLASMDEASKAELLQPISEINIKTLTAYANELGVPIQRIAVGYEKDDLQSLTKAEYADAIQRLIELREKRSSKKNVIVVKGE